MKLKSIGRWMPAWAAALAAAFWLEPAWAQQGAGTGFGGGTSTRSSSQTSGRTASGAFGSRNLGSGANRGTRSFASGTGSRQQDASTAGQLTGNERFLRGNRQGQFVGADTQDMANFFGMLAGGGGGRRQGGMGPMPGLGPGGGRGNDPNAQGNQRNQPRRIPARVVVAFEYRAVAPARLSSTLSARLSRAFRGRLAGLEVQMDGRTAVLRGEVATPHDRVLAEQLALLEAGISEVRNELVVRQSGAPAELPSLGDSPAGPAEGDLPGPETGRQPPAAQVGPDS